MKTVYKSNGIVLGNHWGGGSGSYAATTFHSDISKKHLLKQNENALKDGSLDSGMGFENLIGARIIIETIRSRCIHGKIYTNSEYEEITLGVVTEEQEQFLIQALNTF